MNNKNFKFSNQELWLIRRNKFSNFKQAFLSFSFLLFLKKYRVQGGSAHKFKTCVLNRKMLNIIKNFLKYDSRLLSVTEIRRRKGKFAWESKNLDDTLRELNKSNPEIDFKVDIGLAPPPSLPKKVLLERKRFFNDNKRNAELEKKSRNLTLEIDTDSVKEEWLKSDAPQHIQIVADHYNIYDDLFGDAYFTPYVVMDIYYPQENKDLVTPVCRGNVVKPEEAFSQPVVEFKSEPDELWSLTLVNPDGHFTEENMEYIHWFVGNIPGGDISNGETLWDYLPPFPPRGVGFQRFVFVLYKQEKKIDYSSLKKELPCLELKDRSFKTLEFYRERQDELTPAGLSFFQSDWDKTVRKVFYEILNMEEPLFEYDFLPQYYRKQTWFPKKQPFDKYLDRYRDPKDLNQEYLLKKLKEVDPFTPPKKPFPYPRAIRPYYYQMPSWLVRKEEYYRQRKGRVLNIEEEDYE